MGHAGGSLQFGDDDDENVGDNFIGPPGQSQGYNTPNASREDYRHLGVTVDDSTTQMVSVLCIHQEAWLDPGLFLGAKCSSGISSPH